MLRYSTLLAGFLLFAATSPLAATVEQQTLAHLDQIRAIMAEGDDKAIDAYNRQMDEAWAFFRANKGGALPILRRELSRELKRAQPNNLLLLDIGYFLRLQDDATDKALGAEALFRLDPDAKLVRWNQTQLFHLAFAVAADHDPRMFALLDRVFLKDQVTAFIPQHVLRLDDTMTCVFLYGMYGREAEAHLQPLLADPSVAKKVIEILIWIGSPDSVDGVKGAMLASRDYETFARATAFMMQAGGPQGRAAMLAIHPDDFDTETQAYYRKIRPYIEKTSYQTLRQKFSGVPGDSTLSDAKLKKRLSLMYANYGKDDKTSPEAVFNSTLAYDYLVNELTRIRARMFYRLSDEALTDVQITNAILNALYYRAG